MGDQRYVPAALTRETDRVLIVQEAGWVSGPVWTGAENFAPPPTGIRSPDPPARSESLCRLRCSGPYQTLHNNNNAV